MPPVFPAPPPPGYLTIIPQAWMGSESIAYEAEAKAEWAIDS